MVYKIEPSVNKLKDNETKSKVSVIAKNLDSALNKLSKKFPKETPKFLREIKSTRKKLSEIKKDVKSKPSSDKNAKQDGKLLDALEKEINDMEAAFKPFSDGKGKKVFLSKKK